MITLITGVPGSGKTLYCVEKLLPKIIGTKVTGEDDDGNAIAYDRVVMCNINGLLLEHEQIDREWLENLHENKKPGQYVVFDEVQRVWPNRPTGSKKPPAVEFLETHRHEGIDLVILTQNPQLLDPAVRALVGRHIHIRRVGNLNFAIVYEWDVCSSSLNFKNSMAKSSWRYSKATFKNYKSAKLHTKTPRRLPPVLFVGLLAMAGAAYAWPALFDRIINKPAPGQTESKPADPLILPDQPGSQIGAVLPGADEIQSAATVPGTDGAITPAAPAPVFAGCIRAKSACECYTTTGQRVDAPAAQCDDLTLPKSVQLGTSAPRQKSSEVLDVTLPVRATSPTAQHDGEQLAWLRQR